MTHRLKGEYMKITGFFKLALIALVTFSFAGFQVSCSKKQAPEQKEAVKAAPVVKKVEAPKKEETKKEVKQEEKAEKKTEKSDDGKVTIVKEAFQYTGQEMDKGFKKTGSSIKKAFVGDDKKD